MPTRALLRRPLLRSLTLAAVAAAALGACGGGGDAPPGAQPLTAVYFTDDFSAHYDAVWITVTRVTAVSPAGEKTLTSFDPGQPFNLAQLRHAGALVAQAPLPAGTTQIRVYADPQAWLQALDGSQQSLTLHMPAGYLAFGLESWNPASGVLALDFDLPRFDVRGGTLYPALRIASSDDFSQWNARHAEIKGVVSAVAADRLTVQTTAWGAVDVVLDPAATTYWSETRGASWRPLAGERVEVYALVTGQGTALTYTATAVKDESSPKALGLAKLEGQVVSVSGSTVTVAVRESTHGSLRGTVVIDIGAAVFTRGNASMLVTGRKIEAYVALQGTTWSASAVEIDGAPRAAGSDGDHPGSGHGDRDEYAEVKGRIDAVDGSRVTLTALYTEWLTGVPVGAQITVDVSGAYFKKGSSACLQPGQPIEVKGTQDAAGTLRPVKVELEGGCAAASPLPGTTPPSGGGSPPAGAFVEAKGSVTAVREGEFDLAVYKLEYLPGYSLPNLTVRYGAATVFKHFAPWQLATGQFVEVKGSLTGDVLDATKVELD